MKNSTLILTYLTILTFCNPKNDISDPTQPNIILIISDDQAWTDYGFMGHPHIQTPNIDRLASESTVYTHGYVTAPLCSPSLASLITGLYPHQHGITGNDPDFSTESKRYGREWLIERKVHFDSLIEQFRDKSPVTELLSERGYISFQTGKWWLGSYLEGGFHYGMTHGDPLKSGRHGDYGLEIGRQGLDTIFQFIELVKMKQRPFFLWYAPFLPHAPHNPPDSLLHKYLNFTSSEPLARYWASCEWFDITVGQLLDFLNLENLTENTIIFYVCDNGWVQDPKRQNRYLEGSKRAPYDLGIRTPIMIKWSAHTEMITDTTTLVSSIDIVPTIYDILGMSKPKHIPGTSLLKRSELKNRKHVFSEVFFHDIESMQEPDLSLKYRIIIEGKWKLILPSNRNLPGNEIELYDIMEDPFEKCNIYNEQSEKAQELIEQLDAWWKPDFE
jgi:uncharacterized sulfatase